MNRIRSRWGSLVGSDGILGPLLVILTVVTGLVDAFSYLSLGHVFVANMTGNVVFLAFGVARASGFVWWSSVVAIGSFLVGAAGGGRLTRNYGDRRERQLIAATVAESALVMVASLMSIARNARPGDGTSAALISVLAVALGLQNATVRALRVTDLTTTVLTLTLSAIAHDVSAKGDGTGNLTRRTVSIGALFLGAFTGVVITTHGRGAVALLLACVLLLLVSGIAFRAVRAADSMVCS